MTFRHMNIFLYVCDERSMTAAAEKLRISQPSVSQAIAELVDGCLLRHPGGDLGLGRQARERSGCQIAGELDDGEVIRRNLIVAADEPLLSPPGLDGHRRRALRTGVGVDERRCPGWDHDDLIDRSRGMRLLDAVAGGDEQARSPQGRAAAVPRIAGAGSHGDDGRIPRRRSASQNARVRRCGIGRCAVGRRGDRCEEGG